MTTLKFSFSNNFKTAQLGKTWIVNFRLLENRYKYFFFSNASFQLISSLIQSKCSNISGFYFNLCHIFIKTSFHIETHFVYLNREYYMTEIRGGKRRSPVLDSWFVSTLFYSRASRSEVDLINAIQSVKICSDDLKEFPSFCIFHTKFHNTWNYNVLHKILWKEQIDTHEAGILKLTFLLLMY